MSDEKAGSRLFNMTARRVMSEPDLSVSFRAPDVQGGADDVQLHAGTRGRR